MPTLTLSAETEATTAPPDQRSRVWLKGLLALSIFLIGGEIASRAFWSQYRGTGFFSTEVPWQGIYPSFHASGVDAVTIDNQDSVYDVLMLGGSALYRDFGDIEVKLKEGLEKQLAKRVRVFNVAFPAHNSRDSLAKHQRLERQKFDLVLVYHGINDSRMNNVAPESFREDYAHCSWYSKLNFITEHPNLNCLALPYTLYFTGGILGEKLGLVNTTERMIPTQESCEHGKNIRTKKTFKSNLHEILKIAKAKGEKVVLMTYAYHVPEGFSLDGDQDQHPDYASGSSALRLWGKPAYVVQAIDQHNDAIRELVAEYPGTWFVDQRALLPRSGKHFVDCCHLTPLGCQEFASNVVKVVANSLKQEDRP